MSKATGKTTEHIKVNNQRARLRRDVQRDIAEGRLHIAHAAAEYVRRQQAAGISSSRMGSDFTVPMVLGALANCGGMISDDRGRARQALDRCVPFMPGVERALQVGTQDGLLEVDTHGNHTTRIALTAAGWAALGNVAPGAYEPSAAAPQPPVEQPPAAAPPADTPTPPVGALERLCIRLGVERDEWRERAEQAAANNDTLIERLAEAQAEIMRLRALLPEAQHVHGSNGSSGSLRGRLSATEQEALDRLMREVPA